MKHKNKDKRSERRMLALLAALIILGAIVAATMMAFNKLRELWLEQCLITDVNTQVEIETRRRDLQDTVRDICKLKNGANLATIDFAAKRQEIMKDFPVIKSINISRKLPNKLLIQITERSPFARINLVKAKRDSGLVCDDEGVVFSCKRGVEMLPTIRETSAGASKPGDQIKGRALAAIKVLKMAREPEFGNLNLLEIDISHPDFLVLTLASYTMVKLCWEGMDDPSPASDSALRRQLVRVSQVIATDLQPSTRTWNATQSGIVTADPNGRN